MASEDDRSLEDLERGLYSRSYEKPSAEDRTDFKEEDTETEIESDWSDKEKPDSSGFQPESASGNRVHPWLTKLLLGSIVFFVAAVAIAAGLFFSGSLTVSSDNVRVEVRGSEAVRSGEEEAFEIVIRNHNNVDLLGASLTIQYPPGVEAVAEGGEPGPREEVELGVIEAGGRARVSREWVFLGEREEVKEIQLSLEYKLEGSAADLYNESVYEVELIDSPVAVTVSSPTEISAGRPVTFNYTVSSNTDRSLKDVLLKVQLPFGFRFQSAEPQPDEEDELLWRIGELGPEEEKTIQLTGVLEAEANEERTLTFVTGTNYGQNLKNITAPYDETKQTLAVTPPPFNLSLVLNGSRDEPYIAGYGQDIKTQIEWRNNLGVRIEDITLSAEITGNILERTSVSGSQGGFYRSATDEVVWNPNTTPRLRQIPAGDSDSLELKFRSFSLENLPNQSLVNPRIDIDLKAVGQQRDSAGVKEVVRVTDRRTVKFNTTMGLDAYVVFSDGPFQNTGPVPPRVDQTTTYTMILNASNRFNTVEDGVYQAKLPPFVEWIGRVREGDEVSFDPSSRRVTWTIDELPRRTGYDRPKKQAAFQLRVTPSINHREDSLSLLTDGVLTGRDTYTGQSVRFDISDPTTSLHMDPVYDESDGEVR